MSSIQPKERHSLLPQADIDGQEPKNAPAYAASRSAYLCITSIVGSFTCRIMSDINAT